MSFDPQILTDKTFYFMESKIYDACVACCENKVDLVCTQSISDAAGISYRHCLYKVISGGDFSAKSDLRGHVNLASCNHCKALCGSN